MATTGPEFLEASAQAVFEQLQERFDELRAQVPAGAQGGVVIDSKLHTVIVPGRITTAEELLQLVGEAPRSPLRPKNQITVVKRLPERTERTPPTSGGPPVSAPPTTAAPPPPPAPPAAPPPPSGEAKVAFALASDAVLDGMVGRSRTAFRFHVAALAAFIAVGIGGLAAALFMGLVLRQNVWSFVFGGVSLASVATSFVYHPLRKLNKANAVLAEMEQITRAARDMLRDCDDHAQIDQKISCKNGVLDMLQRRFRAID